MGDPPGRHTDRAYTPREDRLERGFPVEFWQSGQGWHGRCENLSASGMLARFKDPPELWTTGDLYCDTGEFLLELKVRIARVIGQNVGIVFLFRSEMEADAMRALVASASIRGRGLLDIKPPF